MTANLDGRDPSEVQFSLSRMTAKVGIPPGPTAPHLCSTVAFGRGGRIFAYPQLVKVVTVPPNSHLQVFVQFRPEPAAGAMVDADGVETKRIELGTRSSALPYFLSGRWEG